MAATIVEALTSSRSVFAAELRPPRAELASAAGIDAWIDTYHAVRRLSSAGTYVFLTDSAVGTAEEDNLRHRETSASPRRITIAEALRGGRTTPIC